uniref:Calcyphosine n=1 Tax=Suricata suricatta TaxID=37032 RepID=A0A673TFI0_SURSU
GCGPPLLGARKDPPLPLANTFPPHQGLALPHTWALQVPLGPATQLHRVCPGPRGTSTVRVTAGAPPSLLSHHPLATLLRGRTRCQRRAEWAGARGAAVWPPGRTRGRFFRRLDRDKSRSLDSGELRRGLAELGLGLDAAEAEGVCRRWDRDGSGTLDLEEFLRALRPPMSQAREAVIAAAFAKLDRSGDGVVTVDDLRGVYSGRAHPKVRSGEWTEEQVLRRFLDNFDSSEKDGQVTLAEFQDYYSGVSASVDTDEEFVAMMTSAWQL